MTQAQLEQRQIRLAQKIKLKQRREPLEAGAVAQERGNRQHPQRLCSKSLHQATIDTLCSGMNCNSY